MIFPDMVSVDEVKCDAERDVITNRPLTEARKNYLENWYNSDGTSKYKAGSSSNATKNRPLAAGGIAGGAAGASAAVAVGAGAAVTVDTGAVIDTDATVAVSADAVVGAVVKLEDDMETRDTDMPHYQPGSMVLFADKGADEVYHSYVDSVNTSADGTRYIMLRFDGCEDVVRVEETDWNTKILVNVLFLTWQRSEDANAVHGVNFEICDSRGYDPHAKANKMVRKAQAKKRAKIEEAFKNFKAELTAAGAVYDGHSMLSLNMETTDMSRDATAVAAELQTLKANIQYTKYRDDIIKEAKEFVEHGNVLTLYDIVEKIEEKHGIAACALEDNREFLDYAAMVLENCHRVQESDEVIYSRTKAQIARMGKRNWLLGILKAQKEQQKERHDKEVARNYTNSIWIMTTNVQQNLLRTQAIKVATSAAEAVPVEVYMPLNTPFSKKDNIMGIKIKPVTVDAYVQKMLSTKKDDVKRNPFEYLGINPNASTTHARGCARAHLRVLNNKKDTYNLTGMTADDCNEIKERLILSLKGLKDLWTGEQKDLSYVNPNSKEGKVEKKLEDEEVKERVKSMNLSQRGKSMKLSQHIKERRNKQSANTHVAMMAIKQELEAGTRVKEEKGAASTSKKRPASSSPTAAGGSKAEVAADAHEAGAPEVPVKQEKARPWYATIPKKSTGNGGAGQ